MKYMGSKRSMLQNGLGDALGRAVPRSSAFVDLFSGSGAVATHVASRFGRPVRAYDLQQFAAVLAEAVIERTALTDAASWTPAWVSRASQMVGQSTLVARSETLQKALLSAEGYGFAERARELSGEAPAGSITRAYGGYYFSPYQALWLDALRQTLPGDQQQAGVALAALIHAASKAAASPGHTAQPFKANETAGPYLIDAWSRSVPSLTVAAAIKIDDQFAKRAGGRAAKLDACKAALLLKEKELAFLDPPYSSVHYSRFYHVLETVALGEVGEVSGAGRYPEISARPSSDYSITTKAAGALEELLKTVASKGASAMVTFPAGKASNGLSGDQVRSLAEAHFTIQEETVTSRFSTLGGDRKHRAARQDASELILTLSPK